MANDSKELMELITEVFNNENDSHCEFIIDSIDALEDYDFINSGDWISDGKYLYCDDIEVKVKYKGNEYVLFISQSKTGSYHTDWYYDTPSVFDIMTLEEYSKPKVKYSFEYHNNIIEILENDEARIEKTIFKTVQEAIDSIKGRV